MELSKFRSFLTGIVLHVCNWMLMVIIIIIIIIIILVNNVWPVRWPWGLRRGSAAARLMGLRFRILLKARMSVPCECCVLSGRGLCDGPIFRPGNFCRVCVEGVGGSLILIRCNRNLLQLQRIGRKRSHYDKTNVCINGVCEDHFVF